MTDHQAKGFTESIVFTLTSRSFCSGEPIPLEHARDGKNLSPQLDWSDPPPGTQSFVLVM